MAKLQITRLFVGLFLAGTLTAPSFGQSPAARPPGSASAAASQRRDIDLLARAEQRVAALRARLLELQMKQVDLQNRVDDLEYQLSPERIQQALLFVGSVRPMEELRDALRRRIENEKSRVSRQLELVASSREQLEAEIKQADSEVERLRQRLSLR
jgi:TolA-binding protein